MLNNIDFLSPSITLYYFEKRSHTSKIGGFLVLLMVTLVFLYTLYNFYIIFGHKKVTALFYKKFELEAGYYSLNSSSIFNFFQIYSTENGGYFDEYNSKYIHSYITYFHTGFKESELDKYDHWVFDRCQRQDNENNLNLNLLINIDNFTNSACIRYYYKNQDRKYYSIEDKEFIWPYLEHGTARKDNVYLTATVQKCTNNSIINRLFGECPPQKEIDDYINKYIAIYFYFTDTQINPLNYKNPIKKYINTITSIIGTNYTFVENYIHFSPLKIKTNEGEILSKSYENNSFYFDSNRMGSAANSEENFKLAKYYYILQNTAQIYERRYNNIVDILAQIGGMIQCINYLFFWVNYLYNKFIIASDTNKLFFHVKESKDYISWLEKKKNIKKIIQAKKEKIKKKSKTNKESMKMKLADINNNIKNDSENMNSNNNNQKSKFFINELLKSSKKNEDNSLSIVSYSNNKNFKNNRNKLSSNDSNSFIREIQDKSNSSIFIKDSNNNLINNQINIFNNNNKLNIGPKENDKKYSVFSIFENKEDICASPQYKAMKKFRISQRSVQKIDHQQSICENLIKEDRMKLIKDLTFFIFIKSLCLSKFKGSTDFITIYRKNLLSEEHFFKSHIKTSLIEKQYKLSSNQSISFIDCFNNL